MDTPTPLARVMDPNDNTLWIHVTCGDTQWADGAEPPGWCESCSFRTDAWRQLYVDARVGIRRERPRPFGEVI